MPPRGDPCPRNTIRAGNGTRSHARHEEPPTCQGSTCGGGQKAGQVRLQRSYASVHPLDVKQAHIRQFCDINAWKLSHSAGWPTPNTPSGAAAARSCALLALHTLKVFSIEHVHTQARPVAVGVSLHHEGRSHVERIHVKAGPLQCYVGPHQVALNGYPRL
jgi:hypothetical protein